ncbi:MAG: isocitrate lyase/PEP mutase family protein [Desulfobacterales bacterium]|jgi:2-methylisocitrate lyase-like PEP mutase family enzyme|nr:isocitrate lyase/PEP mutase family protein [Desulfobacterales bacterium]
MNHGTFLRQFFAAKRILVSVGVYDALSARIAAQEGAPCIYVTGFGAAAARLGAPDIGLMGMSEMVEHVRSIAGAAQCPVIADADTGYGGPANVRRTVREYEAAGVDVIQLEDQEWPKRCGHMEGKRLVSAAEMVQRIRIAADCRRSPDFLILARTDAIAVEGFAAAIDRARAYQEAGADLLFVEAPRSRADLARIPGLLDRPCLANMVEGGQTPFRTAPELQAMGYAVALFPISTLLAAAHAVRRLVATLLRDGGTHALSEEMMRFGQFTDLIGLKQYAEFMDRESIPPEGGRK